MAVDWAEAAAAPSALEQSLTPRELEWLVTGIHEAGHMVLAMDADIEIDHSEIHQGWWGPGAGGYVQYKGQWADEGKILGRLVACLGGCVAEEKFLIMYGIRSAEAHRRAMESSSTDHELFRMFIAEEDEAKWSYAFCRTRAEVLVEKYWARIIVLGALVCEKKRVTGRQAVRAAG